MQTYTHIHEHTQYEVHPRLKIHIGAQEFLHS